MKTTNCVGKLRNVQRDANRASTPLCTQKLTQKSKSSELGNKNSRLRCTTVTLKRNLMSYFILVTLTVHTFCSRGKRSSEQLTVKQGESDVLRERLLMTLCAARRSVVSGQRSGRRLVWALAPPLTGVWLPIQSTMLAPNPQLLLRPRRRASHHHRAGSQLMVRPPHPHKHTQTHTDLRSVRIEPCSCTSATHTPCTTNTHTQAQAQTQTHTHMHTCFVDMRQWPAHAMRHCVTPHTMRAVVRGAIRTICMGARCLCASLAL
jgi:hypothetical protein